MPTELVSVTVAMYAPAGALTPDVVVPSQSSDCGPAPSWAGAVDETSVPFGAVIVSVTEAGRESEKETPSPEDADAVFGTAKSLSVAS